MGGLFYSLFVSCDFKFVFYINVCAIFTYFLEKITLNELFLWDSQFWEMADFFQIVIRDIAMTCTNIVLGQTLFKLLKLLGPTHKNKRVHDLIVWLCGFLKYAHKLQGGMHLATQDAHLLNLYLCTLWSSCFSDRFNFLPLMPDWSKYPGFLKCT
jgi:hypothetical protein